MSAPVVEIRTGKVDPGGGDQRPKPTKNLAQLRIDCEIVMGGTAHRDDPHRLSLQRLDRHDVEKVLQHARKACPVVRRSAPPPQRRSGRLPGDALSYCSEAGEVCAVALKLPRTPADWQREAVEAVLNEIGGVVTRIGDETVGEMWSLFDGQDILDEVDPAFSENIRRHVDRVVRLDPFHVSANTDPKGDRSKRPQ
jgi:hypothetical protein